MREEKLSNSCVCLIVRYNSRSIDEIWFSYYYFGKGKKSCTTRISGGGIKFCDSRWRSHNFFSSDPVILERTFQNRPQKCRTFLCLNNMIECERHPTLSFSSVVGALTACARYYFAAPINRYVCVYVAAALQILIAHKFNGYFHQVKELYGKKLSLSLYLTHCYLYETIFPFPLHKWKLIEWSMRF